MEPERKEKRLPWLLRPLGRFLDSLSAGSLTLSLPDGRSWHYGPAWKSEPKATLHIRHPVRFMSRLTRGSLGLADAYLAADWDSPDLAVLLELLDRTQTEKPHGRGRHRPFALLDRIELALRGNSLAGSRRNIGAHYDLGLDFFESWLDPTLCYSCAHFDPDRPDEELETAQRRKIRHIFERLDPAPGTRLLEIGSGFGAFALEAAERGLSVDSLTLSKTQLDYAQRQARVRGLEARAHFDYRDYRLSQGDYDAVVSIEMFEAVGEHYWPTYFRVLRDRLKAGGKAVLQVITIDSAAYADYRRQPDFIQLRVFPGGMLPTWGHLERLATETGFSIRDPDFRGADYARTLGFWLESFDRAWPTLARRGYPARLGRLWRYYLAYCRAGFETRRVDLVQFTLEAQYSSPKEADPVQPAGTPPRIRLKDSAAPPDRPRSSS
jgi:cyclopropane-fatty-acyl-phospholipid synthase